MKVLFVCSGGMSSAIVVNALKKEGEKQGINIEVLAVGTQEFDSEVRNGWDVAMVAPQVKHRFDGFKASADEAESHVKSFQLKHTALLVDLLY